MYHRILPIIETEILPTKHYILSADGNELVEINESDVYKYNLSGSFDQNWHISKGKSCVGVSEKEALSPQKVDSESLVISAVGGEPKAHSQNGSKQSVHSKGSKESLAIIMEPFLSSKHSYTAKEGHPKTEYVWRHPPVFETANGHTQPALIPCAFSGETAQYSLDENLDDPREVDSRLVRDSANDGLQESSPYSIPRKPISPDSKLAMPNGTSEDARRPRTVSTAEGEATMGLRRMRQSRAMRTDTENLKRVEKGLAKMSLK